ncbi:Probable chromosome-partitioning protein parB [uncultured Flavonifractor sp.]|nr:DNA-binding protein [Flavonifractor plautii]SCJ59090.1 Probable chromosome-partitioning protein parB [uncultured Flavonifractor sp.]
MAKENTASTTDQASPVKDVEQKNPAPPVPEVSEVKPEPPANEGPASLFEMAEGPSGPGKKDIPSPENVVIPFEKINEIKAEKEAASGKAAKAVDDKQPRPPAKDAVKKEPPAPAKTPKQSKAPKDKAAPAKAAKAPKDKAPVKSEPPAPKTEPPAKAEPVAAPRSQEVEQVVYIKLSELHPFKNHPFQVRDDDEMRAMVESVKDKGITNAAVVRPREGGGYEMVSGHRRMKASELAGFADMPCIVRNLTDEQAITQMVEDNTTQRESILPSERAKALKMQLEAIKRQGARGDLATSGQDGPKLENGQRSNQIVADRNKMAVKQVQRYIKLNDLVPDLMKMVDAKKIAFTPAVELSYIKPKNQRYIAIAIEGQQSAPSLSQAQRMRELDQKNMLNGDVIDGIMLEEKKEVDKVIISSQELSQYFGKDKTPREMKDQILKLLDEWKGKQKEIAKPEKKAEQEK